MNKDFFKVTYYGSNFITTTIHPELLKPNTSYIRLSSILEIGELKTYNVYKSPESGIIVSKVEVAKCIRSLNNKNGIPSEIYLTKESYDQLLEKLDLK